MNVLRKIIILLLIAIVCSFKISASNTEVAGNKLLGLCFTPLSSFLRSPKVLVRGKKLWLYVKIETGALDQVLHIMNYRSDANITKVELKHYFLFMADKNLSTVKRIHEAISNIDATRIAYQMPATNCTGEQLVDIISVEIQIYRKSHKYTYSPKQIMGFISEGVSKLAAIYEHLQFNL
ncbi:MAG: hypothetical protein ISR65_12120 [Bacteriovoracaceae bacterium]|nr:hypothetical protein [Bacteriovoracaceae bacterium]